MPAPPPTPTGETFAGALRPGPQMPPPNLAGLLRAQMQKEQEAEALRFSRAVAPVERKIKRWVEVPVDSTSAPGAYAFYGEKKVGGLTFDTVREPMYEDDTEDTVYKRAQDNFYKSIKDREIYQSLRVASDLSFNAPHLVPGVSSFMDEFVADNPALAKDADLKSLAATLYLSGPSKLASKMPLNYGFSKLAQGGTYLARAGVLRMLASRPGTSFVQGASSILDAGKPMVQGVQAALPGQITPPTPFFHWMGEKFGQQVFQRVRPAIVSQVQQTLQKTGAVIQPNGEIVVPAGASSKAYQEARNAIALLKQELGSTAQVALRKMQGGATVQQAADLSRRLSGGQTLVQTIPSVFGSAAAGAGVAAGYAVPLMLSPDLNMDQRKEIARTIPTHMVQGAAFAGGLHMLGLMGQEFSRTLAKPKVVSNRILGSKGDVVDPGARLLPGPFGPRTPSPALTRVKIEPLRLQTPQTPETMMVQNNLGKNLHEMSQEELVNATSDLGMPQALQPLEDLRLTLAKSADALSRVTGEIQETVRALQDPKELAKAMRGIVALRQAPPPMDPTLTATHGRLLHEWAQGVRDLPGQPQEDIVGILGFDYEPIFAPGTPPEIAGPTASLARWAAGVLSEAQAAGLNIADTLLTAPPPMPGGDPQMALAVAAQRIQTLAAKVREANPGAAVGPPPEVMNVPDELRDAPVAQVTPPKPLQLPDPIVTTLAHAPDVRDFNLDPQGSAVRQAHVASTLWPGGGPAGELIATNEAALLDTDPVIVPVWQDEAGRILATVPSGRDMSGAHEVDITDGLKAAALPVGAEWKFNPDPSAGIAYSFNGEAERVLIDRSRSETRQWLREAQHEDAVETLRNGQVSWREAPVALAASVLENPPQDIESAQAAMREADKHIDRLRAQAPSPADAARTVGSDAALWDAPRAYGEMMSEWWLDMAAAEGTKALLLQNMSEMVQAENAALKARLEAEIEANRMMEEFATTTPRTGPEDRQLHGAARGEALVEGVFAGQQPGTQLGFVRVGNRNVSVPMDALPAGVTKGATVQVNSEALNPESMKGAQASRPVEATDLVAEPQDLDALGFYSKLEREVRGAQQARFSPEQLRGYLKSHGVKDAEIEAVGLPAFLEGKVSVGRDEVLRHIEQNSVRVEEKVLGVPYSPEAQSQLDALTRKRDYGGQISHNRWQRETEKITKDYPPTQFAHLTLPGPKENYREVLYSYGGADPKDYNVHSFSGTPTAFWSRIDDRILPNGKKVRLLEEVQRSRPETEAPKGLPLEKTQHEFVFRRELKRAIDDGMDYFAWTTGEQQAERYSLEKRFKAIYYNPKTEALHAKGLDDSEDLVRTVAPNKLAETIGKEMAERLLAAPRAGESHQLEGSDLKVGGEWAKRLYDETLGNYANKLGKKWGTKVESLPLENPRFEVVSPEGKAVMTVGEARAKTTVSARGVGWTMRPVSPTVHALPITPAMHVAARAKELPGPRFARGKGILEGPAADRADVVAGEPGVRHRDLTSDPFASRAAQARALTEARAWAATGQGWTGKAPLFKLLPPEEKFLAMATRITKGGIRFRAQLDALHPKNYPLNYHGGWTPSPEQRQSLSELYDQRVQEFNEAERTVSAVRTAYDQRAAGKLPARIPVNKLLSVRIDELDEMMAKAPAQALEYMKHLHYNAFNAETDAEVARLADPERIKVAEELDLFREKLRDLEGDMVARMPHPSDPEVNPRVRWWDTLSHSHRMRMGVLKQLTRMVGNPANVLGPFKQAPSLSLLGKAWESGDLDNNFWNILHEADFAKNKEAAEIYDRWRRLHNMASRDAALDKAVSRRLLFRMSKAELEKLPDDQSIPRSGLLTKAVLAPKPIQSSTPESSIGPEDRQSYSATQGGNIKSSIGKTRLSEEMPELYRFFDGIIKDAAEAKTKILPGEMGQHKANIQHLEAERRERVLAAVRVAGAEVETYEDIPPDALDLVLKELRKNDKGTPGGDIWFNGEQMPSGAFSFSHIEDVIKAEKRAWREKDEELHGIRSGKLYRQGYMTQIHQIARPQLEQMLRDPLSPYSRYVTAEWRNKFLNERDPDAKLPFATWSTTMPMYIEALLRTKHMEPAFQIAKSKLSSLPADMRAYAVEQLRALEHIEMPFDALNNRSIVEGSAHEPTGLDNLIEATTGRKRRDVVKEMQALGRADMRPMTTLVRNLNAIAYPLLLNIDRITAMSVGEMGFIPAIVGQGRPTEAILRGAAAIPLQAFNALRAGGEGLTEFLAFLSNQTLGTPRYYSQATKEGQVTDIAYDFEKGGRHFGVPSQGAGPAMRAWHKIANNAFFPMKAAEYTIRSSQFYTIRTLLRRANPHMPEAVVNRLASAQTQRLIGSYGPMDVSPYLRGQGGKFWGALKKFGLNKLSLAVTQGSGTYEAATTLGKGRPPLEPGDQGIGPPQPPPPEIPGMEELAGDEANPRLINWGAMDPEEADRFMQMIVPASQMGAAFPAGKPGSRAAFVGTTMAGIPMAALAATVLNYILFYDDEAVDPTKLNPLSLGNIGEAAPTFWYKNAERYANLQLFGKLFGLNTRQVKEKERIEKEMRYWVPFMGPMLRSYNRRKRLGVSTPGFPTFPQQGLLPEMIEDTPVERGLAEAGKVVSGARKRMLEITETPAGRAMAP